MSQAHLAALPHTALPAPRAPPCAIHRGRSSRRQRRSRRRRLPERKEAGRRVCPGPLSAAGGGGGCCVTPRGCWSTGGGGGGEERGQAARGPAALRLPVELGDESIFCVLDVAGVSGAPQDSPTVSREPAGARQAALLRDRRRTAPRGQERRGVRAEASRLHPRETARGWCHGPSSRACHASHRPRDRRAPGSYPQRRGREFVRG